MPDIALKAGLVHELLHIRARHISIFLLAHLYADTNFTPLYIYMRTKFVILMDNQDISSLK